MKILGFSDLHHSAQKAKILVRASRTADLVIAAGDFCNTRGGLDAAMQLLSEIAAPLVAVPGNHESASELAAAAPAGTTVLHGEGASFDGLELFGLGYGVPVTPFGDWSCDLTEEEAEALLSRCESADILITHSPPKGLGDMTSQGASVGSDAICAAIGRLEPRLALCGHIHDSWGATGRIGQTQVHNLGPEPNWFEIPA
ncbi:MAG: metallophosphoesterase family protein [Pseudomonadota bacterium]|uniref:metallophosphoesterase family protein n=1 Tax=Roseovarius TaxID=74030 RepID=UPI0022A89B2B|nr:metallophosphoesterase [Roseovarius sp. EGI FJ00037]MCZ0813223.1 metallophosphoesterase [Roseovarius sp. EGI FJ00037]